MASNNLELVVQGFKKLTAEEKARFIAGAERDLRRPGALEEARKSEEITMGPLGGGCPCCGR